MSSEASGRGQLIVVSAPSGAGKTSLIHGLLARDPRCRLSVSYTTRAPRRQERDGIDYHFVDEAAFRTRIAERDFLEHAEVFGHWYGTSASATEALLDDGHDVLLEIDWQGAQQVRRARPGTPGVFVLPPDLDTLEQRLRARGQDSDTTIARRMASARDELSHWPEYEFLLLNEDFDTTLGDFCAIVSALRCTRERLQARIGALFPPH
jgi:guanylate kinase